MINTENNLDWLAAKYAQDVIQFSEHNESQDVENTVTKSLGVLQENGVYACFLYILAKEVKKKPSDGNKKNEQRSTGEVLVEHMLNLLDSLNIGWGRPNSYEAKDVLSFIVSNEEITLEQLLLTKETLEQMLIYARYGAKARPEKLDNKPKDKQEET